MAIVRVVLPGVLAVENHRHHLLAGLLAEKAGNVLQMLDEVGHGIVGMPVAVLEADQVGQAVVAEEHPGLEAVDANRREQAALGVHVVDRTSRLDATAAPHPFARCGPADAEFVEQGERILAYPAFRQPYALRLAAEVMLEHLDAVLQVPAGALGAAGVGRRQRRGRIGQGVAHVPEVVEQRHDGMAVRRHRQLDLLAIGERPVARNQAGQRGLDQLQQFVPVSRRIVLLLLHQALCQRRLLQRMAEPGEVIPGQQVEEILIGKIGEMPLDALVADAGGVGGADHAQQAVKCRIGMDHARGMAALAVVDDAQALGRVRRNRLDAGQQVEHGVLGRGALVQQVSQLQRIVVELLEQNRGEIDHHPHLRVALQVRRHVAVVLHAVQVHPRQVIGAVQPVTVIGLVHVPRQHDVERFSRHSRSAVSNRGSGRASPGSPARCLRG